MTRHTYTKLTKITMLTKYICNISSTHD